MNPLATIGDLILELDQAGVVLGVDPDGNLVADIPTAADTDDLNDRIRTHWKLLALSVIARQSGHRWKPCTECRLAVLTRAKSSPKCRMTPGCKGQHADPRPPKEQGS